MQSAAGSMRRNPVLMWPISACTSVYLDGSCRPGMAVCEEFWDGCGARPPFTPALALASVVNLIRDLDTDFSILGKNYVNVIQVSSHLFAMSSACYNPFIYASLHDKFLSYLCRRFLSRRRGKGKEQGQGSSILTMSHRMPRLHTSTIVANLPGAVANNIPQDNYT
ncbi:prolactin-releasing peptide receptor-like protein [Lates japonicus]|uniref:Prolactin-releasing peptide receptor-like protein n=1 Tax=Lates japonicus TaxID=270547 RepID=A0AAD3MVI2_LATJO|nr:prolactin-releasing peptide receptor-like protein [Lates japonicus]